MNCLCNQLPEKKRMLGLLEIHKPRNKERPLATSYSITILYVTTIHQGYLIFSFTAHCLSFQYHFPKCLLITLGVFFHFKQYHSITYNYKKSFSHLVPSLLHPVYIIYWLRPVVVLRLSKIFEHSLMHNTCLFLVCACACSFVWNTFNVPLELRHSVLQLLRDDDTRTNRWSCTLSQSRLYVDLDAQ